MMFKILFTAVSGNSVHLLSVFEIEQKAQSHCDIFREKGLEMIDRIYNKGRLPDLWLIEQFLKEMTLLNNSSQDL